jgi:hypothetical protein
MLSIPKSSLQGGHPFATFRKMSDFRWGIVLFIVTAVRSGLKLKHRPTFSAEQTAKLTDCLVMNWSAKQVVILKIHNVIHFDLAQTLAQISSPPLANRGRQRHNP